MESLTKSYCDTWDLTESGKVKEAAAEYRRGALATIKHLYSEAAQVYPPRFSRIDDWCQWTGDLYKIAVRADRTLQKEDGKGAREALIDLRDHFYKLDVETGLAISNDRIFAFYKKAQEEGPTPTELIALRKAVMEAPLDKKAKKQEEAYKKAVKEWSDSMETLLKSEKLDADTLKALRQSTASFYREYGMQFDQATKPL